MRYLTAASALALLTACALPPEGVEPEGLANFNAAVASIGCDLVDESDYIPVELQTGLSREQVQQVAAYKIQTDEGVRLSNGGFRLKTGECADAA